MIVVYILELECTPPLQFCPQWACSHNGVVYFTISLTQLGNWYLEFQRIESKMCMVPNSFELRVAMVLMMVSNSSSRQAWLWRMCVTRGTYISAQFTGNSFHAVLAFHQMGPSTNWPMWNGWTTKGNDKIMSIFSFIEVPLDHDWGGLTPRSALPRMHAKIKPPLLGRSRVYSWLHWTNLGSVIANINLKFAKRIMCGKQSLPTGLSEEVNSPWPLITNAVDKQKFNKLFSWLLYTK